MTPAATARRKEDAEPARAQDAKILIVDDDERNLLALTQVLEPLAEVVTVASGRDALRALLNDDFAVILLDVFMPEMDGYETAGFIRAREQTARIPIIFLSAVNKETEHLMRGYAMGAVDYVFKPVDPVVLRSKAAVFVDLFRLRVEVEERNRAEQELRDQKLRAEASRLAVERELQAARLRQAAILNSLPLILFEATYSESGGLKRRVVGGDRNTLAGDAAAWIESDNACWEERIVEADREGVRLAYAASAADADRATVRYRWALEENSPLHMLEQAVRIGDDAWVGSITDITAQSQLEDQLLQAQKLDALGQLTGGVAHDFNNLLAALIGGIELLRRRIKPESKELKILDQMRDAADQGVALVKSLLAFARKQPLSPSVIEPQDLVNSVSGLVDHAMDARTIIDWQVDADELRFVADFSQLTLALVNLLINARDAMPDGGTIDVTIDAMAAEPGERERLRIVVRDRGTGIPAELLDKVTEPFFTTKGAGKGTGLGLSMVSGFAEQSGGSMAISSAENEGTTIEIVLPAVRQAADAGGADARPARGAPAARRSVLLVDDDDAVREILADIIQDIGLSVTTAADGGAALELLRAGGRRFDIVLSDVAMPVMDGVELVDAIERENLRVPVALMTGNPSAALAAAVADRTPLLCKPLDSGKLAELFATI